MQEQDWFGLSKDAERLPPFPDGLQVMPVDALLDASQDLLTDIRLAHGLGGDHNRETYQSLVIEPVRQLARIVHLLPATPKDCFRLPGGLFRFGLECGFHSLRFSQGRIMSREPPETRRDSEFLWSQASFLCGLYSEASRTLSRITVHGDNEETWHPGAEYLMDWLVQRRIGRYRYRWSPQADDVVAYTVIGHLLPQEQARYFLTHGGKSHLEALVAALHNPNNDDNPVAKVVKTVRTRLIQREYDADPVRYGERAAGMHLEPWIIDAMRNLVSHKKWEVNQEKSRIWAGLDGIFMTWPACGKDLREELRRAACPYVPNDMSALAEILCDAGVLDRDGQGNFLYDIAIPQAVSMEKRRLEAVRVVKPEILFGKQEVDRLPLRLVGTPQAPGQEDDSATNKPTDAGLDAADFREVMASGETRGVGVGARHGVPAGHDPLYSHGHTAASQPASRPVMVETSVQAEQVDAGPPIRCRNHEGAADPAGKNGRSDSDHRDRSQHPDRKTVRAKPAKPGPSPKTLPKGLDAKSAELGVAKDVFHALMTGDEASPEGGAPAPSNRLMEALLQPETTGDLEARARLILDRIRRLPEAQRIPHSADVVRIDAKAIEALKMDARDAVATLKRAGYILAVNGLDFGLDLSGDKPSRYVLIKMRR